MTKSTQKVASIEKLSNEQGIISALAFDQRGALKRMMAEHQTETPSVEQIERLKSLVSEELTQYASSILLDPEYGLPFFLEVLSYDDKIADNKSAEFAKVKPHKVNEAMKLFSQERFNVDVLKVEVPVNMNYVEGFAQGEVVYSKEEAAQYFKEQDAATNLPYIYLSAGVSAELFQETLKFAHDAGANFNGVLCGRATWAGSVKVYIEQGEEAAREWLRTTGFKNIDDLNKVLATTATSWKQ